MRLLKRKKIRKKLNWFKTTYKLESPYQVIVDPLFLKEALEKKVFIREEIPKILQDKSFIVLTNCIYQELRRLGGDYSGAALMGKRLKKISCPHENDEKPASSRDCIIALASEGNRVMAIQDLKLRQRIRQIPGVPLLYINPKKVVTFENISSTSLKLNARAALKKIQVPKEERELLKEDLKEIRKEELANQPAPKIIPTAFKKKRAKGPNPLAMKKKRKILKPSSLKGGEKSVQEEKSPDEEEKNKSSEDIKINQSTTSIEADEGKDNSGFQVVEKKKKNRRKKKQKKTEETNVQ